MWTKRVCPLLRIVGDFKKQFGREIIMNEKDKEAYAIYENTILDKEGYLYIAKEAWQSACEYKQKEIDDLKSAFDDRVRVIQLQIEDKKKLQAENVKLRECVEFYADLNNHKMIYDSGDGFVNTTEIDKDGGKRARQALKELEER